MELEIIERWQHNRDVEVFFNAAERKLLFKKYNFLYCKGVDERTAYPYHNIEGYGSRYAFCSLTHDERLLTMNRNASELVRVI